MLTSDSAAEEACETSQDQTPRTSAASSDFGFKVLTSDSLEEACETSQEQSPRTAAASSDFGPDVLTPAELRLPRATSAPGLWGTDFWRGRTGVRDLPGPGPRSCGHCERLLPTLGCGRDLRVGTTHTYIHTYTRTHVRCVPAVSARRRRQRRPQGERAGLSGPEESACSPSGRVGTDETPRAEQAALPCQAQPGRALFFPEWRRAQRGVRGKAHAKARAQKHVNSAQQCARAGARATIDCTRYI